MKLLLLGSGGREHALAWKIAQSPKIEKLYVAPGNAGTSNVAENVAIKGDDFDGIRQFVLEKDIDMVVVGPEDPLVKGIYDYFQQDEALKAVPVIGPSKAGAVLEGSKEFAKGFMQRHGIPTAGYRSFTGEQLEEGLAYLEYDPKDTLITFHEKIMKVIHKTRKDGASDTSSNAMEIITKLPQFMINLVVKTVLLLDKHGWAPDALIGSDPNHAAIFLSNLGSIGMEGGYHHLVNWGTNSCFVVLGKKYMKMEYAKDGSGDLHEVIPIGITLDERIADGYYYSGTVALVKELLAHPELLELPADTPVEYAIRR